MEYDSRNDLLQIVEIDNKNLILVFPLSVYSTKLPNVTMNMSDVATQINFRVLP